MGLHCTVRQCKKIPPHQFSPNIPPVFLAFSRKQKKKGHFRGIYESFNIWAFWAFYRARSKKYENTIIRTTTRQRRHCIKVQSSKQRKKGNKATDDITKKFKATKKQGNKANDDITHFLQKKQRKYNIIFAGFGHMIRPISTYPIFLFNIQYKY